MTSMLGIRSSARTASASALALGIALAVSGPALAQEAAETTAPENSEVIIITGSRISTAGFDAPTPTTVVSAADLKVAGRTDIQATLADLPQFRMTQSATSTNTLTSSGQSPADLRGLGSARTLVLVNSRRHVSSNDLQTIPYSLVKSIDVVTGGASAAYGSDAVAGVVNIILDNKREGFELGAQTGISSRGDGAKYLLEGSAGFSFADGRGHFIVGGDYLNDKGVTPGNARPLIGSAGFFPGADGKLYPTAGLRESNRHEDGVITVDPITRAPSVLTGMVFNKDGTLRPFEYGITHGSAPSLMIGGEGYHIDNYRSLSAPIQRANALARASYDLTDNLNVWVEGNYNRVWDERPFFPDLWISQLNIRTDNAFLNSDIRDQLIAAGETDFYMGRAVTDVAMAHYDYTRETYQVSIGVDGSFGGGKWRYNAYYSHGEQTQDMKLKDITLRQNFLNAVDAVTGPGGTPVCRVALTDPTTACRPLNLFGSGNADQAAIDYVTADWNAKTTTWLDSMGASISGEPFELWNQPVSVAAGIEYREQAFKTVYDENSLAGRFGTINGQNIPKTGNNVKEAFAEVAIPLLADLPFAKKLMFNGAARVSDYSTKGSIWSWKIGAVWDINDSIALRATRSRDIRAANLTEMFSLRSTLFTTVVDYGQSTEPTTSIILYTGGNPNVAPEIADTFTAGVVLSPSFMPGFRFSADYYDIKIDDVITTLTAQQIVNSCYRQGNSGACAQIVRNAGGTITEINAAYINVAKFTTKGIDFEASYQTSLDSIGLPGQLNIRGLANYVDSMAVDNGILTIEGAGYLGSQAGYLIPKWRGTFNTTYESEGFGFDIRTRYVDGGGYAPKDVLGNQGDSVSISSRWYFDLGARVYIPYGEGKKFTVYGNVQNVFDRDPAVAVVSSPYHDLIGRYFTVGARINF
ncbi:TonB-dependent receptor plug domain-containing protein [Sphingosinicella microcystinivorans]|uniref:TonB-dependent receptor plug domain-containing protein n=1 Tax=Sphingosinicella microcystinivorans TaxID=335406 RepID=UPI0022F3C963|nr:TonB-dependent receptor [Sphingosinicella microcystinivorans]WBX85103.1 TonB-dependent receptor [Sphingosinicella microcystinivorans]